MLLKVPATYRTPVKAPETNNNPPPTWKQLTPQERYEKQNEYHCSRFFYHNNQLGFFEKAKGNTEWLDPKLYVKSDANPKRKCKLGRNLMRSWWSLVDLTKLLQESTLFISFQSNHFINNQLKIYRQGINVNSDLGLLNIVIARKSLHQQSTKNLSTRNQRQLRPRIAQYRDCSKITSSTIN